MDDVSFTIARGETLGLDRRVRVGQDHDRPGHPRTVSRSPAARSSSRAATSPARAPRSAARCRAICGPSSRTRSRRSIRGGPSAMPSPSLCASRACRARSGPARVQAALDSVGLRPDRRSATRASSPGGQRQRIAIARALVTDPRLVVCDEAVSALDLSTQAQVLNLLSDLRAGADLGYLFIAHDMAVVEFLAQRVVVLNRGRIVEQGATLEVMRNPQAPLHPGAHGRLARARSRRAGAASRGVAGAQGVGCRRPLRLSGLSGTSRPRAATAPARSRGTASTIGLGCR